ncbi:hypothetical protein GCK72_022617 [Caenorhabditis remanei]|uniref:Uncharacterized protein n=1 Tax=Caenorhabditis remanei TaxID=31234 RepID=A0A6A5FUF5_CAERE|nr:hypothetical protein GCK72_022617 [Caenorhabditis remanei]KAF1746164.1 hypothetical protein GCK72_022617 [Caenorhabditis remanei]
MTPNIPRQEEFIDSRYPDAERILDQMVEIAPVLIDPNASNEDVLDACVAIRELNQQLMNFDEHRAFALEFEQVLIRMVVRLERAIAAAEGEAGNISVGFVCWYSIKQ